MNTDLKSKWLKHEPDELIHFIMHEYHQSHRQTLPELINKSKEMVLSYSDARVYPQELPITLNRLRQELFEHMEKEELILFPLLSTKSHHYLCTQLYKAEHNHQDHRSLLQKIKQIMNDFPPSETDINWKNFYADLTKFCEALEEHMMLEEEILFNREYTYAHSNHSFHG